MKLEVFLESYIDMRFWVWHGPSYSAVYEKTPKAGERTHSRIFSSDDPEKADEFLAEHKKRCLEHLKKVLTVKLSKGVRDIVLPSSFDTKKVIDKPKRSSLDPQPGEPY